MQLEIKCPCGWEIRGSEDEVVAAATVHGKEVHNMDLTKEQVLAQAVPVS